MRRQTRRERLCQAARCTSTVALSLATAAGSVVPATGRGQVPGRQPSLTLPTRTPRSRRPSHVRTAIPYRRPCSLPDTSTVLFTSTSPDGRRSVGRSPFGTGHRARTPRATVRTSRPRPPSRRPGPIPRVLRLRAAHVMASLPPPSTPRRRTAVSRTATAARSRSRLPAGRSFRMPASACTSTASSILVSDPRHLRSPLEAVAAVTDLGFGLVLAPVRMATGGARRAIDVRWAVRRVARRAVRVRRDRVQGG